MSDPTPPPRRFPATVYKVGSEPDARFSLANERTFLAWVSTALALVSVGVALESLGLGLQPTLRKAASVVLILAGLACPVQAWLGWMRVERALRRSRPLPAVGLALPLAIAVSVSGLLVLLALLLAR